ncbi:lysophospholipase [Roridomyces roridus]|uniref:Lysophospholipase n=1 Tax=Roridomyces roridus TaxID=1738132 RepID=A0AAD7CG15_9AGAR|nr:lysophospholipase [Roridomyces roridus]
MPLHQLSDLTSNDYAEKWLTGPQSTNFYTRTYLAPPAASKAVVIFIHGFAEHVGRYTESHAQFAARGVNVFTYDQRGFGQTALDLKNKSKTSSYGKFSGEEQMNDVKWAIEHASKEFPGLPVFLCGHSMGGGEVLNFSVRRSPDALSALSGVVGFSPLIQQTKPASKIARGFGGFVGVALPDIVIPAPVNYEDLSHDAKYNDMCRRDPLCKLKGTLRGVGDMLSWGDELHRGLYKEWPKSLPLLIVHGTQDQVTSHTASQQFHDRIVADDKNIITFPDAFHEVLQEPDFREKTMDDVIAFIEAHCSRPSEQVPAEAKL